MDIEDILNAVQEHGNLEGYEVEITDLWQICHVMWAIMTDAQRQELLAYLDDDGFFDWAADAAEE